MFRHGQVGSTMSPFPSVLAPWKGPREQSSCQTPSLCSHNEEPGRWSGQQETPQGAEPGPQGHPRGSGSPAQLWGHPEAPAEQVCAPQTPRTPGQGCSQGQRGECTHEPHPVSLPSREGEGAALGRQKRQQRKEEELLWCHCIPWCLFCQDKAPCELCLHGEHLRGSSTIPAGQGWATSSRNSCWGCQRELHPSIFPTTGASRPAERTQRHQHSVKL